jgi:hypothetical protein
MQFPSFGFPLLNYQKVSLSDIPPEFLFNMSPAALDSDNQARDVSPTPSEIHRLKRRGIAYLTNRVLNSPKGDVFHTITDRVNAEQKYLLKLEEFTYGSKDGAIILREAKKNKEIAESPVKNPGSRIKSAIAKRFN